MEQSFIYFETTVTTLPDEFEFEKVICTYILLRDHKNSSTVREIDV